MENKVKRWEAGEEGRWWEEGEGGCEIRRNDDRQVRGVGGKGG